MVLFSLALLGLTVATVQSADRRLGYDRYAGYMPTTQITDVAAIDLDQLIMNSKLSELKLGAAVQLYENGGHSGGYAKLKLSFLGNEAALFPAGTRVFGVAENGQEVAGRLKKAVSWDANAAEAEVEVKYHISDLQADYTKCQVGGLYKFEAANKVGCFAEVGDVRLVQEGEHESGGVEFAYSYDIRADNMNSRTLKSLSTKAISSMMGPSGEYYPEYQTFVDYYGDFDYGDKWITAAAQKVATDFTSGRGNSDFTSMTVRPGRAEAMKKGAAYLNIWMEVVRELHETVAECEVEKAEHSIDEAVAFYAGSLVSNNDGNAGVLLYALAEIRAHQFKTAGHMGNKDIGDAMVNVEIFREFKKLQTMKTDEIGLEHSDEICQQARVSADRIITLMKVPLIQGVLRYAHIREFENPTSVEEKEKWEDEGATFAAAVLPFIHECDAGEATVLHNNMKVGANPKFREVKQALELSYACLSITCEDVGGVWDKTKQAYKQGATPCDKIPVKSSRSPGAAFAIFLAVSAGVSFACFVLLRFRSKLDAKNSDKNLPEFADNGNIMAVGEIS